MPVNYLEKAREDVDAYNRSLQEQQEQDHAEENNEEETPRVIEEQPIEELPIEDNQDSKGE